MSEGRLIAVEAERNEAIRVLSNVMILLREIEEWTRKWAGTDGDNPGKIHDWVRSDGFGLRTCVPEALSLLAGGDEARRIVEAPERRLALLFKVWAIHAENGQRRPVMGGGPVFVPKLWYLRSEVMPVVEAELREAGWINEQGNLLVDEPK